MMTQESPLGRYTVLRELGRGAIGTVYAARDTATGAAVALKVLDPALFSEPNAKLAELFLENARSAARLRHRNIVRIFDAGEAGGTAFVAMELVEGESLRRMLDERPLSIARAIQIFDDIASALAYAHEEGIVHRGVKPSNIIVSPSGVAKLSDFGTGQIGDAALRYMSPEQVRGDPVDPRSDLFSLGAVFYEMLARRAPFEGSSPQQIRQNIVQAQPPLPSKVNPHAPGALDPIVSRLLAGRADDRFSDARVLLRDLQRLEEELGLGPGAGAGARPRGQTEPAQPPPATKREPAPDPSAAEELQHRIRIPAGEVSRERDARFIKDREPRPEPSSGSRAAFLAALALMLAVLSIGLTVFLYYSPDLIERLTLANRMQEAPTPAGAAAPSPATAPPPLSAIKEPSPPPAISDATPDKSPLVEEPSPSAQTNRLLPGEAEQPAAGDTAPTLEAPRAAPPRANVRQSQPVGMAKLTIAVSPQGELYIDGEHYGTTPPLTTLELEPGMHRIEIRSGSRKPYLTYVTVKAGDERRIRHDFNAKPSRPPG